MSEIKMIKPLKYWVQKILPLVYDDSLSYYELLNKVVFKLNILIENNDNLPEYIKDTILSLITPESIEEILSEIFKDLRHSIAKQDDEDSATATSDRAKDSWIWLNDKLYIVLRDINTGDAYVFDGVNPNVENVSVEEMNALLNETIVNLRHNIASSDDGDSSTSSINRSVNSLVWLDDELYKVLRNISAGDAYVSSGINPNIEKITIEDLIQFADVKHSIASFDEGSNIVATRNISKNELLWLNNKLYKALEDISFGTTYVTSGGLQNIEEVTVEDLLKDISDEIDDIKTDITNIETDISYLDYYVTPEQYGAIADGVTDCLTAIQQAIDENPDAPIYFKEGTYAVSGTIYAKKGLHFVMNSTAKILLTSSASCLIYDNIRTAQGDPDIFSFNSYIQGGVLDGNNLCDVVLGYNFCQHATFKDMTIKNFKQAGIYSGYNIDGSTLTSGAANLHSNIRIENEPNSALNTTGVYNDIHDAFFDHIQIKDCKVGINLHNGGNSLHNVHPWITDDSMFANSIAFMIYPTVNKLLDCTADSMQTGIQLYGTGYPTVIIDTFRFAFQFMSFSAVQTAGGFKFFDIQVPGFQVMATNLYCWVDSTYTSGGKFINDNWYANPNIYNYMEIKNMIGPSYFFNYVANIVPDYADDVLYLGVRIPANSDLNNYLSGGRFYCISGTDAGTIANFPTAFSPAMFTLKVVTAVAYTRQILYLETTNNVTQIATRVLRDGTYGPWVVLAKA